MIKYASLVRATNQFRNSNALSVTSTSLTSVQCQWTTTLLINGIDRNIVLRQNLGPTKRIHCSPTLNKTANKPPLPEHDGINVLKSRSVFCNEKIYYLDLMSEEATGKRFVKISEFDRIQKFRTHILIGLDDVNDIISHLQKGKYEVFHDGESYASYYSKLFENKQYNFIIWERRIYSDREHIEICETGDTYAKLIKGRDPVIDTGTFRILISKRKLENFITELEAIMFDAC